jgi:hypothetical protein
MFAGRIMNHGIDQVGETTPQGDKGNMQVNEFIDAYSDDLLYLREGRQALLTHPLRREIKELCDSSYCRMLAIVMIGSIETMLLEWKRQDKIGVLKTWFANTDSTGKKITNGERVGVLYDAFRQAGIAVDKEVFDDFLAIKYLRNTIVHGKWKRHEKGWLEKRDFPTDTRSLSGRHWNRMQAVNDNMMFYIALTSIAKPSRMQQSPTTIRLPETASAETAGIVRERDLPNIFWLNLERISERIYEAVEQAVVTKEYYWAKNLSKEAVDQLSGIEKKTLFYKAARKAGEESLDVLARQKELANEALYSWEEYCRLTFNKLQVSHNDIIEATRIMRNLHDKGAYFGGPSLLWNKAMPVETASKLIQSLLEGYEPLREDQIVTALKVGNSVCEIMPNITPAYVLNVLLPIVDPSDTQAYLEAGDHALAAMELRESWYWYVEYKRFPVADNLVLYRQLRGMFAEKP